MEAFTRAVTHDVKAPLTSVSVAADRVLGGYGAGLPEPVREELFRIAGLAGKAQKMIADLLAAERIVSEPEAVTTVDLGVVVAETVEVLRPQIEERGVRVVVRAPLPTVPGKAVKLGHVFGNLIGNAIRFVPAGTGVIEVSATLVDGWVVVAVRDNGVGIPEKYRESVFGLFRRVPGSEGAGSGMGLAIVKRVVDRHGGYVWIESVPPTGTLFCMALPAR